MREYHSAREEEERQLFVSELEPPLEPLVEPTATSSKRQVTSQESDAFIQNPSQLFGKQFLHQPHSNVSAFYEVVGQGSSKRKGQWYEIQWEGCGIDSFQMGASEMASLLKDSFLFET